MSIDSKTQYLLRRCVTSGKSLTLSGPLFSLSVAWG